MTTDDEVRGSYSGMRVLVTGGAGAIGSALTAGLLDAGAQVVVLDDLSSGYQWNLPNVPGLLFVRGSILDEATVKRAFHERPEVVFHLAAFFANQNSVDYPERDLAVNAQGLLKILEYSSLTRVSRFVFASSSSIYGSAPILPVTEDSVAPLALTTPYQMTKLLGEMYCTFYQREYGLPTVRARFFNSYGPGEVPGQYRNVIPNFIFWALREEAIPITGRPTASRDFTFVSDIVDGLLRCGVLPGAVGEAYNLAAGRDVTVLDLARLVIKATGSSSPVVEAARRNWDTKERFVASNTKAAEALGFAPTTELEEGLSSTVAWFREHWDRIQSAADFPPGASAAVRGVDASRRLT